MRPTRFKEINVFQKSHSDTQYRIGLVYPNKYSIGMSGLSVKLLYHLLNQFPNIFTERIFFSPKSVIPPQSTETGKYLHQFNVLAFTFQFELDYINALRMLQRSKIPIRRELRTSNHPFIIAGGPSITTNPGPLLDIFDLIYVGEFESVATGFLDIIGQSKFLDLPGFYHPNEDKKRVPVVTPNLDEVDYPTAQVRPVSSLGRKKGGLNGYFLQVARGCPHACHFCLIGRHFRPHRERSLPKLQQLIDVGGKESQTDFFSLIGSSTADYREIEGLLSYFIEIGLKFSLPSLRVDSGLEVLDLLEQTGVKSLTIAPESGSDNIRKGIGKRITNDQIRNFVNQAYQKKINQFKLYFILGFTPNSVYEAQAIIDLLEIIQSENPGLNLNVSVTPLIPKAGTRLGNESIDYRSIQTGFNVLKKELQRKIRYKLFPLQWAAIQAILSQGGRELLPQLLEIAQHGGSLQVWRQVLGKTPIDYYHDVFCP
jgi:radical SAM superfamily enzyme YgiQ (UPF0313 family)